MKQAEMIQAEFGRTVIGSMWAQKMGLTDEVIAYLSQNQRVERRADGNYIFMPPCDAFFDTSNSRVTRQLGNWAEAHDTEGKEFGPTAGFNLPNGALRSPDASWMSKHVLDSIPTDKLRPFPAACPEFVVELRSPSDSLKELHEKMQEYIDNGALLGWLIDPIEEHVHIYRVGQAPEMLAGFDRNLSGEHVLVGFELDMRPLRIAQP
jgi:Uma2 family endonuclease